MTPTYISNLAFNLSLNRAHIKKRASGVTWREYIGSTVGYVSCVIFYRTQFESRSNCLGPCLPFGFLPLFLHFSVRLECRICPVTPMYVKSRPAYKVQNISWETELQRIMLAHTRVSYSLLSLLLKKFEVWLLPVQKQPLSHQDLFITSCSKTTHHSGESICCCPQMIEREIWIRQYKFFFSHWITYDTSRNNFWNTVF